MMLSLLLIPILLFSQQEMEPKAIGLFYAVSESGDLVQLERRTATIRAQSNIFTSSAKGYLRVDGSRSEIRFPAGATVTFIVRVSNNRVNPETQLRLLRFEAKKSERRVLMSEVSAGVFSSSATVHGLHNLGFDAEPYGRSSFKITLSRGLPPGEYAFDSAESNGLFCFAYDKPTK